MKIQWLFTLLNVLFWAITYPLLLVIYWILILLYWITSPLIFLGHFIVQAGLLPFRLLAKLEVRTVYQHGFIHILMYICLDTLYLFRRCSHCGNSHWPDTPFPVKDQHTYVRPRQSASGDGEESRRTYRSIVQSFEGEEAEAGQRLDECCEGQATSSGSSAARGFPALIRRTSSNATKPKYSQTS